MVHPQVRGFEKPETPMLGTSPHRAQRALKLKCQKWLVGQGLQSLIQPSHFELLSTPCAGRRGTEHLFGFEKKRDFPPHLRLDQLNDTYFTCHETYFIVTMAWLLMMDI